MMLKRRRETVVKKAMELATLCDVPVAAIILDPSTGDVQTYPQDQTQLTALLQKYYKHHHQHKTTNVNASDNLGSSSSSADSLMGLMMNELNSKIAAVDHRIQLLKSTTAAKTQQLCPQQCWFCNIKDAINDQGLSFGWNQQSLQNLAVQNIVPTRVLDHHHRQTVGNPTSSSLGFCQDFNVVTTSGSMTNNQSMMMMLHDNMKPVEVVESTAATSLGCVGGHGGGDDFRQELGVACSGSSVGCESFGRDAEECFDFLEDIVEWDNDDEEQPCGRFDDAPEDGFLEDLFNYFNQEPIIKIQPFEVEDQY